MQDIVRGVALTILIFAISIYIPIIGFVFALFIPLPILYYRLKLGRTTGMTVAGLTAIVMILMLGGIGFDILFFLILVLLGAMLGDLFEQNLALERTVLFAWGAIMLTIICGLVIFSIITHTGIISLVSSYVGKNLELTLVLYESMGVSPETIQMISESMDQIQYALVRLMPSLVAVGTLVVIWVNLLIAGPILKARSLFYPDFGPLKYWKVPEFLVWVVIGCGLLLLLPSRGIKMIGLNGLFFLLTLYFFQGMAIVSYFFEKKRFPRALRFFLYSLIALQQLVLLVVIGLGFFDVWLNFRKLGLKNG